MRKIILGTDWWSDCDDAVALRLITKAHKNQEIELLSVGINACMDCSCASLLGFLHKDGVTDVPIGIDRSATGYEGAHLALYQERLAREYAPNVRECDFDDALRVYRKALASCQGKLEIIEIGFLGVIADVLKSDGDDISPKTGLELVREKVSKIWVMAGKWDKNGEREHNFALNEKTRLAGFDFLTLCPVPVTFLGFETGLGILTGDKLDPCDHLYSVMSDYGAKDGRHSWDPMLVLLALEGDEERAGYSVTVGTAELDPLTGLNYFKEHEDGRHKFVTKARDNDYYRDLINSKL